MFWSCKRHKRITMDISGIVIAILESQSGTSNNGNAWIRHAFVIETPGQYPKNIKFDMFSKDSTSKLSFGEGDNVTVSFNLESREYNSKWYSNINAFKVTTEGQRAQQDKPKAQPKKGAAATDDEDLFATPSTVNSKPAAAPPTSDTDDLPF